MRYNRNIQRCEGIQFYVNFQYGSKFRYKK